MTNGATSGDMDSTTPRQLGRLISRYCPLFTLLQGVSETKGMPLQQTPASNILGDDFPHGGIGHSPHAHSNGRIEIYGMNLRRPRRRSGISGTKEGQYARGD